VKRKQTSKENPGEPPNPYLSWRVYPGQMAKMRIHRNRHHFTVHIPKFICFVAEGHNFCGADEGAGQEERAGCNNSANLLFFRKDPHVCFQALMQQAIFFSQIILTTFCAEDWFQSVPKQWPCPPRWHTGFQLPVLNRFLPGVEKLSLLGTL